MPDPQPESSLGLIGTSDETWRAQDFVRRAAKSNHTILLLGETGSGKDYLAELIHNAGRSHRPFVPVDCGALTESLSESELFGHIQGAFTDAQVTKEGLVQVAEEGTLFFNEVANMSLGLQAKFLRILEKRTFRAVGATRESQINTRIIAATNANLGRAVRLGQFRLDLYHRLNVLTFTIAPLRKRTPDILVLAEHFLQEESSTKIFSQEAMNTMMEYPWPGNVRELKNAIVGAVFHSGLQETIELKHLQPYLTGVGSESCDENGPAGQTLEEAELSCLRVALIKARGNYSQAAVIAGISRRQMKYKIDKYDLKDFVRELKSPNNGDDELTD